MEERKRRQTSRLCPHPSEGLAWKERVLKCLVECGGNGVKG